MRLSKIGLDQPHESALLQQVQTYGSSEYATKSMQFLWTCEEYLSSTTLNELLIDCTNHLQCANSALDLLAEVHRCLEPRDGRMQFMRIPKDRNYEYKEYVGKLLMRLHHCNPIRPATALIAPPTTSSEYLDVSTLTAEISTKLNHLHSHYDPRVFGLACMLIQPHLTDLRESIANGDATIFADPMTRPSSM